MKTLLFGGCLSEGAFSYFLLTYMKKKQEVGIFTAALVKLPIVQHLLLRRGMATLLGCVLIPSTSPSSLPCCWLLSWLTEIIHDGVFRNTKIFIKSALIIVSQNYLLSSFLPRPLLTGFSLFPGAWYSTSSGADSTIVEKTNLPVFFFLRFQFEMLMWS